VQCNSWQDYIDNFGGHGVNDTLPNQVRMVYKQDPAATVKVVRVVNYTDVTDLATKTSAAATIDINSTATAATAGAVTGTVAGHTFDDAGTLTRAWRLANADTIIVHCDEDGVGPDTATITASGAVIMGGATALPVNMGDSLTFTCDSIPGSQLVTYAAAHATVELAAQDINSQISGFKAVVVGGATINFEADTLGSDSAVGITVETGTGAADIGHAAPIAGFGAAGNVGDVYNVTWQELKLIIEAAVVNPVTGVTVSLSSGNFLVITSNTTGILSRIMVEAASTADDELGLDNALHTGSATSSVATLTINGKYDGTYAHDLRVVILTASNGDAAYFNLQVTDSAGVVLETFPNLQIATTTDADYVETVINASPSSGGSKYIAAVDLLTTIRPVNGTSTPAAGDDGLIGIADTDFLGDPAGGGGLHAFDTEDELTILIDGGRATSPWQTGIISYIETYKNNECFAVLDPPAGRTAATMVNYATGAALIGLSEFGGIYWPRIKVLNPLDTVYTSDADGNITVAPSGAIAGVMSRNDAAALGGVWKQPAGSTRGKITGALGLETEEAKDIRKRGVVFPQRINPITTTRTGIVFIDGEKGLKATGNFPYVGGRRGMIFVNTTLREGLEFVRHADIDEDLMDKAKRSSQLFLKGQGPEGVKGIKNFWVQCDESLNPPSTQEQTKFFVRYAVETKKPAIWVVLLVGKDTRSLEDELSS